MRRLSWVIVVGAATCGRAPTAPHADSGAPVDASGDDATTGTDARSGAAGGKDSSEDPGEGAPQVDAEADARADAEADAGADGPPDPCPAGCSLVVDDTACSGVAVATPSGWASAIQGAMRGDTVALDTATLGSAPCLLLAVCQPDGAPTLLFSDSPETPSSDGVLYADTVGPGSYRLYVYQANGGAASRKFPVVILNQGPSDAHVVIARRGLGGAPSTDYVGIGKAAVLDWLASTGAGTVTVPPSTRVLLDPALDALQANAQQLVHAIYDVTLDAPVKVSFVSVASAEDAATLTASLPLLPADPNHTRGTFPGAERWFLASAAVDGSTLRTLRLGEAPLDPPLSGTDATSGMSATLGGNYGVLYRLEAQLSVAAGLTIFARGGPWGGGAIVPAGMDGTTSPVSLPSATSALPAGNQAVLLGRFAAATAFDARLLSAGGSSLPIDVAVAPLP